MNLLRTRSARWFLAGLIPAGFLLLVSGCYLPYDSAPVYSQPAYVTPSTSLVIVMEGEATREDYEARRAEIINYLIERGYIQTEEDLVADPDQAERVIRAIVSPDGGFTLSVFNRNTAGGASLELWDTDLLYPADPYFILGFIYMNEIGPRRLPPPPPNYQPHPHPPHYRPPSDKHVWDSSRHWSHRGAPDAGKGDRTAPTHSKPDGQVKNHLPPTPASANPTALPEQKGRSDPQKHPAAADPVRKPDQVQDSKGNPSPHPSNKPSASPAHPGSNQRQPSSPASPAASQPRPATTTSPSGSSVQQPRSSPPPAPKSPPPPSDSSKTPPPAKDEQKQN